jgi:GT2 family glycosyltransferase
MTEGHSEPLYSVVILNWNGGEGLLDAVESVFAQTFGGWELLLVDNASTDGSAQRVVARYSGEPRLSWILNATNLGYCVAHNHALAQCRGRYILTLNPDVVLDRDFLQEMRAGFDSPDTGIAAPHAVRRSDPRIIDSAGTIGFPHLFATAYRAGQRDEPGLRGEEVFGAIGAYAVYSRKMLDDVCLVRNGRREYFDTDFFTFFDEADLQLRARWRGWKCRYVPRARAVHGWRYSIKQGLVSRRRLYHLTFRNHYLSMFKNMAGSQWIRALPSLLLHEAALLIISLRCRWPIFLTTKAGALRLLPRMIPKRKAVMKGRRISVREYNESLAGFGSYCRFLRSVLRSEREKGKLLSFSDH